MAFPVLAEAYLGGKAFSAASKAWGASQQRKKSKKALGQLSEGYMKKSPYEQEWLTMLRKRMTEGALPTREMVQRVSSQVGETGQVARQKAQGYAASRGLEHSGVAASMTGQVDASMLRSIADQARAIAIQNEMTKTGAQQEFGQYAQGESGLIRQLATMKYGGEGDIRSQYVGAAGDVGAGVSGFGEMKMGQQESARQRQDAFSRWSMGQLDQQGQQGVDEDELFDMIKDLTPEQQMQFLKMWGF